MIIKVTSPYMLSQVMDIAEHLEGTPLAALEKMLLEGIRDPKSHIIIEKKNDEVRGFLYASIEGFRGELVAFIQSCYISPKAPNIGFEILTSVRNWAKDNKIEKMVMITPRSWKGFERKYKFKAVSTVMTKEV
jgi:hypothetical protein